MRTLVALLGTVAFASTASAASLGGDCCLDLEERVAELEATTARKGNSKVSLTVHGRVNKAFVIGDFDGEERDYSIMDNSNLPSYFGFTGGYQLNKDVSVGFSAEIGIGGHDGNEFFRSNDVYVREASVNLDSETFGRLTLGRTRQATDRISQIDVSNARIASTPLTLRPFTDERFGDAFDGGRGDLVRYDSPELLGFQVSGSFGASDEDDGSVADVALRYAGEFGAIRVAAGVGYRVGEVSDFTGNTSGDPTVISGSASVQHVPTGLFLNASAGRHQVDGFEDVDAWGVKGGIELPLFGDGQKTTVFAEYGDVDDSNYWGAGLVQDLGPAQVYVSGRQYNGGELFEDRDGMYIMSGLSIRF